MRLPTLYSQTSKGGIEQWSIRVEAAADDAGIYHHTERPYNIITEHGLVGGKLQESIETVRSGKNLGKTNATTPFEQAISQAKAEWNTKKTRKGYTEDLKKAEAGGNDGAGGIRPMLAKKWTEHGEKVVFPIYVQPKLDGIRCIAIIGKDENVSLWSREQKQFLALPKLETRIAALGLPAGTILDGEFYNHELRSDFEKIASCTRKPYPVSDEEQALIQYHVYDLPSEGGHFGTRWIKLALLLPQLDEFIIPVETKLLQTEEELLEYFEQCRGIGYEGCMIRALEIVDKKGRKTENDCYEEDKRSYFLLKMKEFEEDEFPIVGVKEGVGKMAGLAIFECTAKSGNNFDVKLEGALENLRQYITNESTWKGKKLTVQYQGITNKKQVPRFPVGKVVRDYE
jgi:DNA ligase-1